MNLGPDSYADWFSWNQKLHDVMESQGHLLAPHGTPANLHQRSLVGILAEAVKKATGA